MFQEHNIQPEQKAIREPLGQLPYLFTVRLGKKNTSAHSYNGHGPQAFLMILHFIVITFKYTSGKNLNHDTLGGLLVSLFISITF